MVPGNPIGVYGLEVSNEMPVFANEANAPVDITISMAAIDPTEKVKGKEPRRATLVMMRVAPKDEDEEYDDEEDDEEHDSVRAIENRLSQVIPGFLDEYQSSGDEGDSDDDSLDEQVDRTKLFDALKALKEQVLSGALAPAAKDKSSKALKDKEESESEDDDEDNDEDEDDDEDNSDDEEEECDEFVICTLDEKTCQQPLNITIAANEQVFFRVKGNLTVHLTGNYVIPHALGDEDEEDDYDSEDDEDPLGLLSGMNVDSEDDSEDELDDIEEEPRIVELKESKNSKKRAAEESKPEKAQASDKKQKKLKANSGEPVPAAKAEKVEKVEKTEKAEKPSKADKVEKAEKTEKVEKADKPEKQSSVRNVKGVTVEDKKIGKGAVAKVGDRVDVRYIGKLTNGNKFDSNTKGKPFSFKLGKGEVIKGWDVGVAGMAPGGERRLTVPASMAYGKQSMPGIPSNSTLIFEVKLLSIH